MVAQQNLSCGLKKKIEILLINEKKMNRSEEFMLTLPINASTKYNHNNKHSSSNVILPATYDLQGTWAVAIVNKQYPLNWPDFNEEFVELMVSAKEKNEEKEWQKEQQAT